MPKKKEKEIIKNEELDLSSIKKELNEYIDKQLDEKLEKSVSTKVRQEFVEEIEKVNKKIIRSKNRKLFVKNIFLILFLGIILLLLYLLYQDGHFDKYFSHTESNNKEVVIEKENSKEDNKNSNEEKSEVEYTLDELKEKYGSYIEPYYLNKNSIYLEDFYQGKLSDEIKNYIVFNNLDFNKFVVEDDYQTIDGNDFCNVYNELFDGECNPHNFNYDGHKIRYFKELKKFITDEILEKESSNISREIIDIKVNDDRVDIEVVEAIIDNDSVYSVYPYQYIGENKDFVSYQESLNHITYTFKNNKLISIG